MTIAQHNEHDHVDPLNLPLWLRRKFELERYMWQRCLCYRGFVILSEKIERKIKIIIVGSK